MTDPMSDWYSAAHDSFVASEGPAGAFLEKTRDAVAHGYANAIEAGEIERPSVDLVTEGRRLYDQYMGPTRTRRRESLKRNVDYLLDAVTGRTLLGRDDPIFAQAYPLGDGRGKALGLWTHEDWSASSVERTSGATVALESALGYESKIKVLISAMQATGSAITSDLFGEAS